MFINHKKIMCVSSKKIDKEANMRKTDSTGKDPDAGKVLEGSLRGRPDVGHGVAERTRLSN